MKRKLNYSKSHSDLKSHKARIQHYHEDKGKTPGLLLFQSNTQPNANLLSGKVRISNLARNANLKESSELYSYNACINYIQYITLNNILCITLNS